MCNLSEVVLERGMELGKEQGYEQGLEQGIEIGMERGKESNLVKQIKVKLSKGLDVSIIADMLEEEKCYIQELIEKYGLV